MDKTTKLIRCQRITIGLLLLVSLCMTFTAHEARRWEDFWHKEVSYSDGEIGDLERRHDDDQRVIRDLDTRLKQYEKQYGEIKPTRQGEGTYIGRSITRGVLPSR